MIAIIGAGMAGLSAAQALSEAGHDVRVFDKGRGPGGRMSTRRAETQVGPVRFDHGAPCFEAKNEAFRLAVKRWIDASLVEEWRPRSVTFDAQGEVSEVNPKERFVGVPSMNAIIRAMAEPFDVEWGRRVSDLTRTAAKWDMTFEDGSKESGFDAIIIATPIEQARDLYEAAGLGSSSILAPNARSKPVWALMLAFDEAPNVDWDAANFEDGPLGWLAREASKPGRVEANTWVAHASDTWSLNHLERDKDAVAADLSALVCQVLDIDAPIHTAAHRWRYSQLQVSETIGSLWQQSDNIGFCGDWCLGPNIEDAWLSGRHMAMSVSN